MTTRRNTNRRRWPRAAGVVALAVAIMAIPGSALASSHRTQAKREKPTIVLVHGGWADSSGWNREVTALQRLGYPVIAPANPLSRARIRRHVRAQRPADHRRAHRARRPLLWRRRHHQRRCRRSTGQGARLYRRLRTGQG
jgi:hypothetical protein